MKSGDGEGGITLTSSKVADGEGRITLTSSKVADNDNIGLESQGPKKRGTRLSSHGLQIKDSVTLACSKVSANEKID